MLEVLRERICLHVDDSPLVLHEGRIAKEFGVSRTPVREVLLTLAAHRMVETRPGVGTMALPLVPTQRNSDIRTYVELTRAAAVCCDGLEIDRGARGSLLGQVATLNLTPAGSAEPENYVKSMAMLVDALGSLVPDGILSSAMQGAHWRVVRWRTSEISHQGVAGNPSLTNYAARVIESARKGYVAQTLETAASLSEKYIV